MSESLSNIFNSFLPDLGKLHPNLHPSTKIYRTVDFFSAALAVESGKLRLTRMADFSDVNEGVDRLVRALISSVFGDLLASTAELQNSEAAARSVLNERSCTFVSSWSLTAESHAMWGMYSTDQCSVRMQTTVGRLHELGITALEDSWKSYSIEDNQGPRRVINAVSVDPVEYVNIQQLLMRLARRKALATRLIKPAFWTNDLLQIATNRRTAPQWRPYLNAAFLKDQAYHYEGEIRLTLKRAWSPLAESCGDICAEIERERKFYEEFPLSGVPRYSMLRHYLESLRPVLDEPEYLAAIPKDFIQSICLDPRAPFYKKVFIEEFFAQKGIASEPSKSSNIAYLGLSHYPNIVP